ncbi:MAG: alginate export family protein [Novosphingobium sp.]
MIIRGLVASTAAMLALAMPGGGARAQAGEVEQTNWRYDKDWSVLRDTPPDPQAPWWRPVKYVPLSEDGEVHASFGLEARTRHEGFRANLWGGGDAPDDGYLWLRLMPHVDLHAGPVRAFVQPMLAKARGVGAGAGPADTTGIDMLQSFADLRLPLGRGAALTLRGGRALLPLGSERLVGTRYGPNVPQAFDGALLMLDSGPVHARLILVKPVAVGPGDFDDRTSDTKRLRGLYTTTRISEALSIDAYWLNYRNEQARFVQGIGREKRDTFGLRAFGHADGWAWNWEAMLQRRHFDDARIRAWSLASETSYRFADSTPEAAPAAARQYRQRRR